MQTAAHHPVANPSTHSANRLPSVCVVDSNADGYQVWQDLADAQNLRLRVVDSAEEALRLPASEAIDLWLINVKLPGLSGCEFCAMLKSRDREARVLMVADEYSAELERAALSVRATMFAVKPVQREWLDSLPQAVRPANRPIDQTATTTHLSRIAHQLF